MTASDLKDRLKKISELNVTWGFAFPYVQLFVNHKSFTKKTDDDCESLLAEWLGITVGEFRETLKNALISIQFLSTPNIQIPPQRGHHWLERPLDLFKAVDSLQQPTVIHFFGYKGGQARSTVMALLARQLVDNGRKVLVIDADLEAPSLPDILGVKPRHAASTLLGLYMSPEAIPLPVPFIGPNRETGNTAGMIAARPSTNQFDWEYDAFTLKALMDPSVPASLGQRLIQYALTESYDAILVDQRSGASPATLNWMASLPGGFCIFAKLDDQWRGGGRFFQTLVRMAPTAACAVVSFQPDSENPDTYRSRNATQIEDLNDLIQKARLDFVTDEDADLFETIDRWVLWPYHPAFRSARLPSLIDLSPDGRNSLLKLRDLLELPAATPPPKISPSSLVASLSGSNDQADLIQTKALSQLRERNNSYSYVFGRKGTGKSRLFKALAEEGLHEPFIGDEYFKSDRGFLSSDLLLLTQNYKGTPLSFWWRLLQVYLGSAEKTRANLNNTFKALSTPSKAEDVRDVVASATARYSLAIDGLETAFMPNNIYSYVGGLFTVMRLIQSDPLLSEKIDLRLFLRTDLSRSPSQNLEQQIRGRVIYLTWDFQRILNFLLSRIPYSSFLQSHFSSVCTEINQSLDRIRQGEVEIDEAMDMLLKIFPDRLPRMSILMRTFFKLHFADSAYEEERYYPRFVQQFLDGLNASSHSTATDNIFSGNSIDKGRISPALVYFAHDEASRNFLEQIRQELSFVLELQPDRQKNDASIERLLRAFSGKQTPFILDDMCKDLAKRLRFKPDVIREAMDRMKNLAIFEERPGYEGKEWRVGRLFRAALKMKLRR